MNIFGLFKVDDVTHYQNAWFPQPPVYPSKVNPPCNEILFHLLKNLKKTNPPQGSPEGLSQIPNLPGIQRGRAASGRGWLTILWT